MLGTVQHVMNVIKQNHIFLIQKAAKETLVSPAFLKSKNNIVFTKSSFTWNEFLKQRKRWAGKMKGVQDWNLSLIASLVFVSNLFMLLNIGVLILFGFKLIPFLYVMIKIIVDIILAQSLLKYFEKKENIQSVITCILIYPFYIIAVSYYALVPSKFEWKKRVVQ